MQNLRRMSAAALNFLTPSKARIRTISCRVHDLKEVEQGKLKDKRNRRTGKTICPRKKRYSLCDEYEDMYEYINYFTQARIKEANILSSLKNHIISNLDESSPVLEQTSVGDVLRVVNSLNEKAIMHESVETTNNKSPLFTLFQNETSREEQPRKLRTSSIPSKSSWFESKTEALSLAKSERRRYSTACKQTSLDYEKSKLQSNKDRRFSLAPSTTYSPDNSKNRSFSSNIRRLSPSTTKERSKRISPNDTLSVPQVRRIRSEFLSQSAMPAVGSSGPPSQKIKRFLVKPVTLPLSSPEIIVTAPSPLNENDSKRASFKEDDEDCMSHRL